MHCFCSVLSVGLLLAISPSLAGAQQYAPLTASGGSSAQGFSNWRHVLALPPGTNVHISTDHGGRTCHVFAASDDTLTCSKGNAAGAVLQRQSIKSIKLTHYGRSTLVGAGVGGATGAIAGGVAGRTKPCPTGQGFCLNGVGIGAGGLAAVFGVAGGALGAAIGGPLDITRGSAIYVRP